MRFVFTRAIARMALLCGLLAPAPGLSQAFGEWTAYGHDAQGTRYSPLTQIDRGNVGRLTVAWTYRTGEVDAATKQALKFEATPLMVDGTLYLSTPLGKVVALDPETGRERWTFQARVRADASFGDFANRGVSTWLDPRAAASARCRRRIFAPLI